MIPAVDRALENGSVAELNDLLSVTVREQVEARHARVMTLRKQAAEGVPQAREHVEATLGLQVWAHHLYQQIMAAPHSQP